MGWAYEQGTGVRREISVHWVRDRHERMRHRGGRGSGPGGDRRHRSRGSAVASRGHNPPSLLPVVHGLGPPTSAAAAGSRRRRRPLDGPAPNWPIPDVRPLACAARPITGPGGSIPDGQRHDVTSCLHKAVHRPWLPSPPPPSHAAPALPRRTRTRQPASGHRTTPACSAHAAQPSVRQITRPHAPPGRMCPMPSQSSSRHRSNSATHLTSLHRRMAVSAGSSPSPAAVADHLGPAPALPAMPSFPLTHSLCFICTLLPRTHPSSLTVCIHFLHTRSHEPSVSIHALHGFALLSFCCSRVCVFRLRVHPDR